MDPSLLAAMGSGRKTETRRVVKEGTAKIIFNLVKSQKWFRFMRDRANDTMVGWGAIRRAYYQRMESMDEGVPLREGFPGHSLREFQGLKFFNGLGRLSYLLVIEFDYHALGPNTAPYPPIRVMSGPSCCATCKGARGTSTGTSPCAICKAKVHEERAGCATAVMKARVDTYKRSNEDDDESDSSGDDGPVNGKVLVCLACACTMGLKGELETADEIRAARAPLVEHSVRMSAVPVPSGDEPTQDDDEDSEDLPGLVDTVHRAAKHHHHKLWDGDGGADKEAADEEDAAADDGADDEDEAADDGADDEDEAADDEDAAADDGADDEDEAAGDAADVSADAEEEDNGGEGDSGDGADESDTDPADVGTDTDEEDDSADEDADGAARPSMLWTSWARGAGAAGPTRVRPPRASWWYFRAVRAAAKAGESAVTRPAQ
jgi:hypothetical protein